jgi:hypothetical protein
MSTAIRAARRFAARKLDGKPGVFEVHLLQDRRAVPIGCRHVGDFWEDHNHLLGDVDVSPDYLNCGRFVGVVHQDGAYLVEVGA